jgi:ferredoxin
MEDLFFRDDRFLENMLLSLETRMGRVFANESLLADTSALEVLDYDRVSTMVQKATHISLAMCFCRHKAHHLGRACAAPADNCISLNQLSRSLASHGTTRPITVRECMEVIERAQDANLVQIGENVQDQPAYICNCCGCCCEFLNGVKHFGSPITVSTSNYLPEVQAERCNGCGLCVKNCPIEAVSLQPPADASGNPTCRIDDQICLGCGICVKSCRRGALTLRSRSRRLLTPVNITHRVVLNALENGTLPHLILNTQASRGHRALAALLGAILDLKPVHRLMASQQVRSVYLARLLRNVSLA